ncbi:ABC-type multidrug transport system, ATPase component [Hahella chejuensis KCTC 2396]|uniref:ABC-type multidrug transport system, ATPase component n=1 Tax=Hahella chejuensis (strain KCTC 2396) TaxID=349521 RepID=Q2SDB1_HAHCH|nr:ABC transporter ATP-binding protein [Hahella chejuensis]ABC31363.1 ABC-type multidrug transport system, ATPase component [Hahella chejuensis KCTC 2396]
MINVQNLSRHYGDFTAVNNVSFNIESGRIVGLLGHNGAGKTTIMKMLMGYLEPSSGNIRIDGKDMREHSLALRADMGYLPENPPTYPEMTVVDYLDYAAQLRGTPADKRRQAVIEAVARTDLRDKALNPISTLSRGYRQRVGVAQAIINRPKILILDEPTNGLDPSQIQHMRDLITSLRSHSTVILSTHIMQEVSAMCDRVLMIRHGELALDSSLAELQKSQRLLLRSSSGQAQIKSALADLGALQDIQPIATDGDTSTYALNTSLQHVDESFVSDVARKLVNANLPILALHPEVRDLETVFKEVNQVAEVPHAA